MFGTTQSSTDAQCSSTQHGRRVRQSIFRRRAGKEQAQEIETSDGMLMLQGHRLPRWHGRRVPQILKFKRRAGKEPSQERKHSEKNDNACSRYHAPGASFAKIQEEVPLYQQKGGKAAEWHCQSPASLPRASSEKERKWNSGFIASSEFRI